MWKIMRLYLILLFDPDVSHSFWRFIEDEHQKKHDERIWKLHLSPLFLIVIWMTWINFAVKREKNDFVLHNPVAICWKVNDFPLELLPSRSFIFGIDVIRTNRKQLFSVFYSQTKHFLRIPSIASNFIFSFLSSFLPLFLNVNRNAWWSHSFCWKH